MTDYQPQSNRLPDDFESTETLGPFLENAFGDRFLYPVNRESFNGSGSEAVYASRYGENLGRENTLHIFIGTDSGLLINYVHDMAIPTGSRFLFIELPGVLSRIGEVVDWNRLDSRISCVSYEDWFDRATEFHLNEYIFLNSIDVIKSIAAEDSHLAEYRELYRRVSQEANLHFWEVNGGIGNESFFETQIANLAENRISANCLKGLFSGKTAVLLAGGPSLDDIFPWLALNRDKVVVLAVSRISRRLLEMEIAPDIVFSIDPYDTSFDVSREMLELWRNSLLVNSYHAAPRLLGQWRGKSVYVGKRFPWNTPLNEETLPDPGPTVTNTAFAAAVEMGFAQIILGGVDLCFSRAGYCHAKGSNEFKAGPQFMEEGTQVETNGGWPADTNLAFAWAVDILGGQAATAAADGCRTINPAAGAAKIPNVTFMAVDEIEIEPLHEQASCTLAQALPVETTDSRREYYQTALNELSRVFWQLQHIKKLAVEGLRCNDGLFGRNGRRIDFKYKKRMDKIEKTLNTKYKGLVSAVKKYGIKNFIKITRVEPDKEWTDEEIERTGRVYYESYRDSAVGLADLIKQARIRFKARLEEEKEAPDFDLIFKQLREDKQPGRVLVWQTRRQDLFQQPPDAFIETIRMLEEEFRHSMESEDFLAGIQKGKQRDDAANAMYKAFFLFNRRDLAGLRQLADILEKHNSSDLVNAFHLAGGYIAEIENRPADALDEYQRLMTVTPGPLLEEVLRRVSSISLGLRDMDNALVALECLASISPVYMPQYAEMLRLTGAVDRAVDIYLDYLERVPGDLVVMLKLGRLQKEMNIEEGARLIFNHVLTLHPRNKTAKALLAEMGAPEMLTSRGV